MPPSRQAISVRIDRDVMDFFKSQGHGYQTRINAVLRSYMGSVAEKGRVGDWRGNGRRMGVAVPGSFRNAGASLPAMAPFPVAALRTGQADLPHPALQWDHASRTRNTLATAGSR